MPTKKLFDPASSEEMARGQTRILPSSHTKKTGTEEETGARNGKTGGRVFGNGWRISPNEPRFQKFEKIHGSLGLFPNCDLAEVGSGLDTETSSRPPVPGIADLTGTENRGESFRKRMVHFAK